jgi:ketosteroid isomerase-like protein
VSQENVETVRALQPSGVDFVEAFRTGDESLAAIAGALSEEVESVFISDSASATIGPNKGLEGFVAGWRDWLEPWERYELVVEDFIDAGDRVVVFARVHARTRRDGVEMEHAPAAIYTLREGRLSSVEFYLERDEAMRSAGLA